jgi:hypothetical protein
VKDQRFSLVGLTRKKELSFPISTGQVDLRAISQAVAKLSPFVLLVGS